MGPTRIFVIGLDGATFDLIHPWIQEGKLPTLGKLMKTSSYGLLESTIPPLTAPAWTSFMTGVNPGKHGVFDFLGTAADSSEKVLVNSSYIRSRKFWDIAGDRGKKSIILYVPLTYPAEKTEGILISGIPAPGKASRIYPEAMEKELEEKVGPWWVEVKEEWFRDLGEKTFSDEIEKGLETRFRVANYLIRREWDIFVLVFSETDITQHLLWQKKEEALFPLYRKIDGMIGDLWGKLEEQDMLLILSDHGAGPVRKVLYLNSWLKEKGFLSSRKKWVRKERGPTLEIFRRPERTPFLGRWKGILGRRKEVIDWNRTEAHFLNLGQLPGVWINLPGQKMERYGEVCSRVMAELEGMVDDGKRVVEKVFRRETIYSGPYVKNAPDILFLPDLEYLLSERIRSYVFKNKEDGTASHRLHGIFLLCGPGVRKGKRIEGGHIMDVAPTILHLLGLPVPQGMDGRVLTDALQSDFLESAPVRFEDVPLEVDPSKYEMTEKEAEEVKKMLKGLGYID